MKLLRSTIHPDTPKERTNGFSRHASRAIVLRGEDILLLYTERYHDYSLPGGGIDEGENQVAGLIRELREETGAQNISNIKPFGLYEEFRPWYKKDYDFVHMLSYCYVCQIDTELLAPTFEQHEIQNGMTPVWKNIHHAIAHNEETIAKSPKKGMSIERETFLLKLIVERLISK